MSRKKDKTRSTHQLIGNRARELGLTREDAFTAYVMDRLLDRLGRSKHAQDLYLKGGLLVANLVDAPHRFTRDIDLLRRHGPPSPDELREIFRDIVAVPADDGVAFHQGIKAERAEHDADGYDGVKVWLGATVGKRETSVRIDIGFGDAVAPPATRRALTPFLADDEPAREEGRTRPSRSSPRSCRP
ncbi:MAG: nucleotidyl transferase AbiEii/AbiGii toxin family protein [Alphaproteobacteria bacterium]|nr:nucleotidyl transferase AbiEii/AbiGii toxin family protein [Alphaproteobacteria bacterium]